MSNRLNSHPPSFDKLLLDRICGSCESCESEAPGCGLHVLWVVMSARAMATVVLAQKRISDVGEIR